MKLSEFIDEHVIKVDLEAEEKLEAIEELVDFLISEHELSLRNRETVLSIIFKRESSISTGVGGGVAIPHGTIDCINDIVGAIGLSKNGIEFDAFDGEPVHIVLLLLVPKSKFGLHIRTLAHIAKTLNTEEVRNKILAAGDPEEVLEIIEDAESNFDE